MKVHPEYGKPGGPPTGNPGWYREAETQQWRLDPARKLRLDREGIHVALGALLGFLPYPALWWGQPELLMAVLLALALSTALFLAYEITEGIRIRDWAYRDIGGFLIGFVVVSVVGLALSLTGAGA